MSLIIRIELIQTFSKHNHVGNQYCKYKYWFRVYKLQPPPSMDSPNNNPTSTRRNTSPLPDLLKYKTQSTTLHKTKQDLFPTIQMIPKRLSQVQRCYHSAAKLAQLPADNPKAFEQKQFQQIKKVLEDKIAEKRKKALDMKREESRIRWTIEREVKLKMKEEEETRMKREIEFYRTECWRSMDKGVKIKDDRNSRKHKEEITKVGNESQHKHNKNNPEKKSLSRKKKNNKTENKSEQFKEQIEQLKGKLRQECVNVLKRQDAVNSLLISFRGKH